MSDISAEQWTESYPVGTPMLYHPISMEPECEPCTVRSEAWALGHGAVVAKVTGRAGGVLVSHLRLAPSEGEGGWEQAKHFVDLKAYAEHLEIVITEAYARRYPRDVYVNANQALERLLATPEQSECSHETIGTPVRGQHCGECDAYYDMAATFELKRREPTSPPEGELRLADKLEEATTVLDEPVHRAAVEAVMMRAVARLRALLGGSQQEDKLRMTVEQIADDLDFAASQPHDTQAVREIAARVRAIEMGLLALPGDSGELELLDSLPKGTRDQLAAALSAWVHSAELPLVEGTPLPGQHTAGGCMTCQVMAEEIIADFGYGGEREAEAVLFRSAIEKAHGIAKLFGSSTCSCTAEFKEIAALLAPPTSEGDV